MSNSTNAQQTPALEAEVHPFANGSQFMDWLENNCCNCARYSFALNPATGKTRDPLEEDALCQIELALHQACWGDGSVSPEIAQRMGYSDPLAYGWRCGEFDPVAKGTPDAQ